MLFSKGKPAPTGQKPTVMIRLKMGSAEWTKVEADFKGRWQKNNITDLRVEDILRVKCSEKLEKAYAAYKASLRDKAARHGIVLPEDPAAVSSELSSPVLPLPDGDFVLETELYHGTSACLAQAVFDGGHLRSSDDACQPSPPHRSSSTSSPSTSSSTEVELNDGGKAPMPAASAFNDDDDSESFLLCEDDFKIHITDEKVDAEESCAMDQQESEASQDEIFELCTEGGCAACSIARSNFDLKLSGKGSTDRQQTGIWQRFGHGLYFAYHTSKCHFYSKIGLTDQHPQQQRYYSSMMKFKVALGKMRKVTSDHIDYVSPPKGYDSVAAFPNIHRSMKYHEYIVYTPDACLPIYLVAYSFTATSEYRITS